ncbi:endo-1,4-beta-xylanase [Rheinheimera muenzenbergensis]|uniref:Beta-xylanase n=1 Tax=Rheinheimera muenzenbergensis TaxID=1193628 RepID=A0ABU8C9F9_9GAMM
MSFVFKVLIKAILLVFFVFASGISAMSLKDAYKNEFLIGVALANKDLTNSSITTIANNEFNTVTAEFGMKMTSILPESGVYNFAWTDQLFGFVKKSGHFVVGHTLVWHKALPEWLFCDRMGQKLKRDQLLLKLQQHINTYVGRYRGQVLGWDVVNEAFNYDGSFRNSPWLEIIGEDYIEKAFEFAHQADPNAELYYNDYGLVNPKKQAAVVALVKRLKKKGIPIHAVGIQGHYSLTYPDLNKLDKTIARFAKLGVKVMITELDVSVLPFPGVEERGEDAVISAERLIELNPYPNQLPDEIQQQLTSRYRDLFCVFLKHQSAVSRVTFWGLTDSRSWRNNWPIEGRTDYPLLFDRALNAKPVVDALLELPASRDDFCNF